MVITNNSSNGQEEEEAKNEGIRRLASRQWSSFRNPRIVRVSRSFGGKDRHSKVCTVRGLRDRRIRLSVPTAVELYDLQDKLGLNQPSKVVDLLLDATKEDIDKLPPLQMPPRFAQFLHHQQAFGPTSRNLIGDLFLPYESNPYDQFQTNTCNLLSKQDLRISDGKFWDMESGLIRTKSKQAMVNIDEKGKSIELQKTAQSFFPALPTTNAILPYSYNNLQPQAENLFNPNAMSLLPSSGLYLCPTTLPSLFPTSYLMPSTNETADTRPPVNHFQLLNNAAAEGPSSQTSIMPASTFFQTNVINSKYLHHLHHNHQTQSDN